MSQLASLLNEVVKNPQNRDVLQIVKSVINAFIYGGRLRFVHGLAIQLIFKRKVPLLLRLRRVLRVAVDHGVILSAFALLYKSLLLLLSKSSSWLGVGKKYNEFVSGAIAAYFVYGHTNDCFNKTLTHQITLYCSIRVALAVSTLLSYKLAKLSRSLHLFANDHKKLRLDIQKKSWTAFTCLSWGLVMYLHQNYPKFLNHSLESSMAYIYDDTMWFNLKSFLGV